MDKVNEYLYTIDKMTQEKINTILLDICLALKQSTNLKKNYIVYISALLYIKYIKDTDESIDINFKKIYQERNNYYITNIIDDEIRDLREATGNKNLFYNIEFKEIEIHRQTGETSPLSCIIECIYKLESLIEDGSIKSAKEFVAEAYEYVLKKCIMQNDISIEQKEFYTPYEITNLLTDILIDKECNNVYDPHCGSANFLISSANKRKDIQIIGEEDDIDIYNICMTKLLLSNIKSDKVFYNKKNITKVDDNRYDIILTNPPFSQKNWYNDIENEDIYYIRKYGLPYTAVADYAYVIKLLRRLNNYGRMAIILPHGVLFRENEVEVRRKLVIDNNIEAIIGLPENLFYTTRMSIILLIISKKRKKDDSILFIDASKEYESGRKNNYLTEKNRNKIIDAYMNKKEIEGYSHIASIKEIEDNQFNLTIKRYVKEKKIDKIKIKKKDIMKELADLEKEESILEENINDVLEALGIEEIFHKNNIQETRKENNIDYEKVGRNIKKGRINAKYTQEDLAEKLDVSVAYISRIESGATVITLRRLNEICNALNISILDILK